MRSPSLNHAYKLVWSQVLNAWVVVSEIAKGKGKSKSQKAAALVSSALFATATWAGPEGGVVTDGSGTIHYNGATTTINQASQTLNLNWNTFNVASHETVNFVQPSATALAVNQILDANGSRIMGNINANGQVWLINPNGIYFGAGAQINVGSLLASTLNPLTNANGTQVFGNGGTGSIINHGNINATHGYVAFVANTVSNAGNITANGGTVALGAGSQVSLKFADNQLLSLTVDQSTLNNLAENKGLIQANGGAVFLSAGARDSLLASVVNNEGVIEAKTVDHKAGKIILLGGMAAGTTKVKGILDASAQKGNGGFIETSAGNVDLSQTYKITTKAHNIDGGNGKTGTWLIDPNDYTIAASGGNITGTQLGTDLASNNITISTATQGTAGGNGDIFVRDNVTWSSGNTLTLNAERNIRVLATIDASQGAGGKVTLNYGQGAVAANNTATYDFGLTGTGFTGKINLRQGDNFSTKLGSDGSVVDYYVVTQLGSKTNTTSTTDLQGISNNPFANYVLGVDIDASSTGTAGFRAIGSRSTGSFMGKFDGLGHIISNLTVGSPGVSGFNSTGLFGYVSGNTSSIKNIGLTNVSVNSLTGSSAGGLIGVANGTPTITDVFVTGLVQGGGNNVGGLVGTVDNFGSAAATIKRAYSNANVSGGASNVGGLVGNLNRGSLTEVYATGTVTGATGGMSGRGGLVGNNFYGTISKAYATGNVNAGGSGFSRTADVGGLVGSSQGGSISDSYATGNIISTYASPTSVGGLVGSMAAAPNDTTITNSYWDTQTTGLSTSAGTGAVGKTTAEMQTPSTFVGWNVTGPGGRYPSLDFSKTPATWVSGVVNTLVNYNFAALTGTYIYKIDAFDLASLWSSASIFGNNYSSWIAGTDYTFSQGGNTVTGFSDAGTYSNITVNVLRSGFGVATTNNTAGSLTIAPKVVSLSGTREYDRTTNIANGVMSVIGTLQGQSLNVSGTGSVANSDVGSNKGVTGTFTLSDGNNGGKASNYTLTGGTQQVNITPKRVTLTAGAVSKTYDGGLTYTTQTADLTALTNQLISGDSVTAATISYTDKNAGTNNKTVTLDSVTINDGNNGNNYLIQNKFGNSSSTINQATLTYKATSIQTPQGQTPMLSGVIDGLVGGDTLANLTGTLSWTTNANLSIPGFYAITGTGLSSQNYIFAQAAGNATALTVLAATPTIISTPSTQSTSTQSTSTTSAVSSVQQQSNNSTNNNNTNYGPNTNTGTPKGSYSVSGEGVNTKEQE